MLKRRREKQEQRKRKLQEDQEMRNADGKIIYSSFAVTDTKQ
jgi:hypothetical protein